MEKFTVHTGQGAPLRVSDVDTDQIVPVRFLSRLTKRGYGEDLFADWREDPDFVLNRSPYDRASVLVAGTDFGTGSSREGAVYALVDHGFRAIIAPRFGDIFTGNAYRNGLLPVVVPLPAVEALWELLDREPATAVTVDLEQCLVSAPGLPPVPFQVPEADRHRLLAGLDDIGLTMRHDEDIARYEARRRRALPTTARRAATSA